MQQKCNAEDPFPSIIDIWGYSLSILSFIFLLQLFLIFYVYLFMYIFFLTFPRNSPALGPSGTRRGREDGIPCVFSEFRWLLWLSQISKGGITVPLCGEIRQEESLWLTTRAREGTQPTWRGEVCRLSWSLQRPSHSSCLVLTRSANSMQIPLN